MDAGSRIIIKNITKNLYHIVKLTKNYVTFFEKYNIFQDNILIFLLESGNIAISSIKIFPPHPLQIGIFLCDLIQTLTISTSHTAAKREKLDCQ